MTTVRPCPTHHATHAPPQVARTSDPAPNIPSSHGVDEVLAPRSPVRPNRLELGESSTATAASATSVDSPAPTKPTTSSPSSRAAPTTRTTCARSTAPHATPTRPAPRPLALEPAAVLRRTRGMMRGDRIDVFAMSNLVQ